MPSGAVTGDFTYSIKREKDLAFNLGGHANHSVFWTNMSPTAATIPHLLLDVWEHAYCLDYQNVRPDYKKAPWNIANWTTVQERYEAARSKTPGLMMQR